MGASCAPLSLRRGAPADKLARLPHMQIFTVLLEFVLIVALGVAWWAARRDLVALATRQQTPALKEIEAVQSTVEKLLERLEQDVEAAERRIAGLLRDVERRASRISDADAPAGLAALAVKTPDDSSARYAEVYHLADEGIAPAEIARRTGLGSAEVQLVIGHRPSGEDRT